MNNPDHIHDLLVIGGGINGVGIAADAAGRGLDVVLCEKSDLAAATSSVSSKLIHGGLRYLEYYQFGLVRKSLRERENLTRVAPHLIKPIPFQIPLLSNSRSKLLLRAGLFLYDNLTKRSIYKGSKEVKYDAESPLNETIRRGFEYWDGQVDDSRLVIVNAIQAAIHGAQIRTRTECMSIQPEGGCWKVRLRDHLKNEDIELFCKVLVNASGPWVSDLLTQLTRQEAPHELRLVKGSHLVVPKIYPGNNAFLLQHHDGRVVFVIPYLNKYSLIGTTEEEYGGDLDDVAISKDEVNYLISIVNLYFRKSILRSEIVNTYSGVRPLIEDSSKSATKASRDFRLETIEDPYPLLSVYGGKVTTYRVLAESVMNELGQYFPRMRGSWTRRAVLPGGDFDMSENLFRELASKYAWLGPDLINRWLTSYGTISFEMLKGVRSVGDMGVNFGSSLYQLEVDYLCRNEWARTAEDILWRRSKLGYLFGDKEKQSLSNYIQQSFQDGANQYGQPKRTSGGSPEHPGGRR